MIEEENQQEQLENLCPHGNSPDSCESCKISGIEQAEVVTESVDEEIDPAQQEFQNRRFLTKIRNGIVNADKDNLDKIQEMYGLTDDQFEVVGHFAYHEDGELKDESFRREIGDTIAYMYLTVKGADFSNLPPRAIIDLAYRQLDKDRAKK